MELVRVSPDKLRLYYIIMLQQAEKVKNLQP